MRVRTQLYLVRVQAARASVSPPWISLDYSVSSFIFLKLHAMFLKKFIASTCQSLTRKLFSTPRACRKPDVGVVRTTTNRRPSLLSCFELMSSNLPNNKANQPITLTQSCLKANLPSHCALTHSGHKYKPNKPSHCTRWPLRQMTRCGHKANKPSHSARWPLRQMKSDKSQMVTGLISGDCSSQDHDKALTSYSSEKIENHSVTISENVEVRKKRVNCQRKRDREPSRVPVKIILKALSNTKSRNRIKSFVRQHLPDSSFITNLCRNYNTWKFWYTNDHYYSKFVFYMNIQKRKFTTTDNYSTCNCRQTHIRVADLMNSGGKSFPQTHNDNSKLNGGMSPENGVSHDLPWDCLTERLRLIGLVPHDVGGFGDCFFKSVSHQLYRTADLHLEIRMAGIGHLQSYPELYIESISNDHWNNYIQQMSKQGTWCDNIIMQAVANAYNCVIHITQSNINSPESTILTPVADQDGRKTIFIGYINELHYVSTLTDKNSRYKNKLTCIKRKLSETNENRHGRLLKHRNYMKRVKYTETANERASRLEDKRGTYRKTMSEETAEKRKERLKNNRDTYRKRVSEETVEKQKERLKSYKDSYRKRTSEETVE